MQSLKSPCQAVRRRRRLFSFCVYHLASGCVPVANFANCFQGFNWSEFFVIYRPGILSENVERLRAVTAEGVIQYLPGTLTLWLMVLLFDFVNYLC